MTITLKPHQEQAIDAAIADGRFDSVEEFIDAAIAHLPEITEPVYTTENTMAPGSKTLSNAERRKREGRKSLPELFAESPLAGLDLDFSRNRSAGRSIDL